MQVAVIGGGIIGLSCALELYLGGADVVLIEADRCGQATSRGNAGWIIPAITLPVATPDMTRQALSWLLRPSSPLRVRPRADAAWLQWCWQLWRQSGKVQYEHALDSMLALSRHTVASFDALAELGINFDMRANGMLIAARSQQALTGYAQAFAELARRGYPQFVSAQTLDGEAARRLEPALAADVQGGLLLDNQRQVRPETVCRGIYDYLCAAGVPVKEHTPVSALQADGRSGWRIHCTGEQQHADQVVVAAGLWSRSLLAPLGYRLPLQGARGCSITARGRGTAPTRSIKMAEAEIALNPFADGHVRLSGTWDLVGNKAGLERRRLQHVIDQAGAYLADWQPAEVEFEWAGLRPSTPDSLPLIGALPGHDGLYVAAGHGMFGLTYGPLTGRAIRDQLLSGAVTPDMSPLDPARWLA